MAADETKILCANCGCKQRVMKLCTACKQEFYCSRKCQVNHWLCHKSVCQESREKRAATDSADKDYLPTSGKNSLVENHPQTEGNVLRKSDVGGDLSGINTPLSGPTLLNGKSCPTLAMSDCNDRERNCGSNGPMCSATGSSQESTEVEIAQVEKTVTIIIKHNKKKHKLPVPTTSDGRSVLSVISEFVCIPESNLKLIHKGKLVTFENIEGMIVDQALFLAFGEISECELGLEKSDIDLIVKQLNVERNVAVRVLRKTGNVIDAMFEIGNM